MNRIPSIKFGGRLTHRIRGFWHLLAAYAVVLIRRSLHNQLRPGWSAYFEIGTTFCRYQMRYAFGLNDIQVSRAYLNSLQFRMSPVDQVRLEFADDSPVSGRWFMPELPRGTILYIHGGGFAHDNRMGDQLIGLVATSTGAAIFTPAYRLTPEHPYPAQLKDSLAAYEWLLQRGVRPSELVVAGDSAGGTLVLCLLRALRTLELPMPAAAVCISPWTDLSNGGESVTANEPFDIIDRDMIRCWAQWYTQGCDPKNPDISPFYADTKNFPPLYIQAGGAEILIDMVKAYCDRCARDGADIKLDIWEHMNHDFQIYGNGMGESEDALRRIGRFVASKMRT